MHPPSNAGHTRYIIIFHSYLLTIICLSYLLLSIYKISLNYLIAYLLGSWSSNVYCCEGEKYDNIRADLLPYDINYICTLYSVNYAIDCV